MEKLELGKTTPGMFTYYCGEIYFYISPSARCQLKWLQLKIVQYDMKNILTRLVECYDASDSEYIIVELSVTMSHIWFLVVTEWRAKRPLCIL